MRVGNSQSLRPFQVAFRVLVITELKRGQPGAEQRGCFRRSQGSGAAKFIQSTALISGLQEQPAGLRVSGRVGRQFGSKGYEFGLRTSLVAEAQQVADQLQPGV